MRPARRDVLRAAGAAAVLGLGSACARIPVETPIDGRALGGRAQPGAPYVRALPPEPDATPEEVVAGFVQAGVGPEDDFAMAREYLAGTAREQWNPHAQVTIYSGSQELQVEVSDDGEATLVVRAVAMLDGRGARSLLSGPTSQQITVGLEPVDDQWRLTSVPDGIFLSEAAFETLYAPARLYFLDPRREHLVPDHRWFSLQRGAPGLIEGLIAGPVDYLAPAVHSEVPSTPGLTDAVITTAPDGTVQVTVPQAVAALPADPRALALAQLENSLRSFRPLSGVRLVWEGADGSPADEVDLKRALPGHRPIAAGPTGVISLADISGSPPVQLVPDLADVEISSPVIAQDGVLAAALTSDDSAVVLTSTDGSIALREAATGGRFVPPRIDDVGYVWTSTRASSGVLLALSGAGPEHDAKIDAPWLSGRRILTLDIAADATRMVVLSADTGSARLDLCAVRRDEDGVPSALTEPIARRPSLDDVTQASWYDEVAVLVLGEDTSSGEQRAQIVDFASDRDPLPPLNTPTEGIAGTVVADTIWASTSDDTLLRSDGDAWTAVDLDATDPWFY